MLRHGAQAGPIWTAELERVTRCSEAQLFEVVLRLRLLHWNVESGAMKNILQRYTSDAHYGLADTPALPYNQLRFNSKACALPKVEFELPEYSACKSAVEKADSSNAQLLLAKLR